MQGTFLGNTPEYFEIPYGPRAAASFHLIRNGFEDIHFKFRAHLLCVKGRNLLILDGHWAGNSIKLCVYYMYNITNRDVITVLKYVIFKIYYI